MAEEKKEFAEEASDEAQASTEETAEAVKAEAEQTDTEQQAPDESAETGGDSEGPVQDEDADDEEESESSGMAQEAEDTASAQGEGDKEQTAKKEASDSGDAGKGEKSGFFKKKKDKRDEQIEELNDRLRRQMAEFDNFRKRTEKEKSQMFDMGARTIIEKILPIIDNFERGFTMVEEADKEDAFVTGMDKVYRQLMTELEAAGVKAIETEGCEFDPNLHNAVMQVENEELESGMIAQELQKGYKYKDTVVRHSMVSVVQ